jgi:hypothetical protein
MLQGPLFNISGTVACAVVDNDGVQTTILTAGLPWTVNLTWTVVNGGLLIPGMTWRTRVYMESIGPGNEVMVGQLDQPVINPHPNPYTVTFNVPANVPAPVGPLPSTPGTPTPSGLYKLVAVVTLFHGPANAPIPLPIAGYAETPMIQFM